MSYEIEIKICDKYSNTKRRGTSSGAGRGPYICSPKLKNSTSMNHTIFYIEKVLFAFHGPHVVFFTKPTTACICTNILTKFIINHESDSRRRSFPSLSPVVLKKRDNF